MISFTIKYFNELNIHELYALLQLRSEVFVVEQDCVYQDIDGKDNKALHVLGFKHNQLVAYTRVFRSGDYFENASIGRVIVKETERKHKYGFEIMNASIHAINEHFNETVIKISAQKYLESFYMSLGFKTVSEPYLEDGIPHIAMLLKP
ncbi:GNAT family N-acetyltransferase [Formosa sediminum]|uniref:GNAT family N-acetyltransferase n=1 Tax=Formosa sediminum TaxID=2594004 RepID=A0A516GNU9_9FLAO|nr:GNAT family N-acetyltransferase [Formosa sediminum]QDO93185.1 GNAT family N-acetyltransferase [Formosa sediminum]